VINSWLAFGYRIRDHADRLNVRDSVALDSDISAVSARKR